jgi:protein-tyrosine phosphatase
MTESAARHLAFDQPVNFRDVGGYITEDGRQVRWRTVYRSDSIVKLSPADRTAFAALGIALVVDLRTQSEVDRGRFAYEELGGTFRHLPLITQIVDREQYQRVPGFAAIRYQQIAREGAGAVAAGLTLLTDPDLRPAVVHCTAGKDRTGILIAVLLSALGVDDETVAADYALSGPAMVRLRARLSPTAPGTQVPVAATEPESTTQMIERLAEGRTSSVPHNDDALFAAEPDTMRHLLRHLREEHGSIEGYLRDAGGDAGLVAALRAGLLQ